MGKNSTNILNFEEQFDKGCEKLEKELSFYDFNEEFLQYRPLEINQLEKSLLDLKNSLLLTSKDNKPDKIIEYSKSEEIFNNFKNKNGIKICQSNIGNLLSQLLKYNEAIYHLVLSIKNPYLKKYLSKSIKDEFDEKDNLLNLIDQTYNKNNKSEYKNKLVLRQQNNSHNTFPQKEIHKYIFNDYEYGKQILYEKERSIHDLQFQTLYMAYVKNKYNRKVSKIPSEFFDITQAFKILRNDKKLFSIITPYNNYDPIIFQREKYVL
jgi:hypothetical protein